MAGSIFSGFSGEVPRLSPKLLPAGGAQLASNCKLTSGDLEAWAGPEYTATLSKWSAGNPIVSVHRVVHSGGDYWLHWVASELSLGETVKLFVSPTVGDTHDRLYFNKGGKIYITTKSLATTGAGTNYPLAAYELGVAAPADAPAVVAAQATTETQTYAYTYYSAVTLTESALLSPTGSAVGYPLANGNWLVTMAAAPAVTAGKEIEYPTHRRLYRNNLGTYKKIAEVSLATVTVIDSNLTFGVAYLASTNFYAALVAPTVVPAVNPVLPVDIIYVYTLVTIYGEESAPSPPQAATVTGQPISPSFPWNITMAAAPSVGARAPLQYRRLYRTFTSSAGATEYMLVAEILAATTTYVDTVSNGALGEVLPSDGWRQPPTGVTGFTYFGNGVFAVLSGKTLYLSEPFQPHAFPAAYQRGVGFPGVALEAVGNSLIILTDGDPTVLTGTDPSFLSDAKLDINQPCVSAGTVINVGSAVAYMSPVGYVFAGMGGSQIATRDLFARSDWIGINPSGASFATRYDDGLMFFTPSHQYLITPSEQLSRLSSINLTEVTALYTDPETGDIFYVRNSAIYKWDAGTTKLSYLWRSKQIVTPQQANPGICKIETNAGAISLGGVVSVPGGLGINESGINGAPLPYLTTNPILTFRLYARNQATEAFDLKHTEIISSSQPFRLPSGYKSDVFYIELEGTARVHAVYIAETPANLKALAA